MGSRRSRPLVDNGERPTSDWLQHTARFSAVGDALSVYLVSDLIALVNQYARQRHLLLMSLGDQGVYALDPNVEVWVRQTACDTGLHGIWPSAVHSSADDCVHVVYSQECQKWGEAAHYMLDSLTGTWLSSTGLILTFTGDFPMRLVTLMTVESRMYLYGFTYHHTMVYKDRQWTEVDRGTDLVCDAVVSSGSAIYFLSIDKMLQLDEDLQVICEVQTEPQVKRRRHPAMIYVDRFALVCGGWSSSASQYVQCCAKYDTVNRRWLPMASMSLHQTSAPSVACVDGRVYAMTNTGFGERYDMASDSWVKLPVAMSWSLSPYHSTMVAA